MKNLAKCFLFISVIAAFSACGDRDKDLRPDQDQATQPVVDPTSLPKQDPEEAPKAIGAVAVSKKGKPLKLAYGNAYQYCLTQGSRLPTVREFALFAAQNGAAGVRETAFPTAPAADAKIATETTTNTQDGYTPIFKRDAGGKKVVAFYFNPAGDKTPIPANPDDGTYWSSPTPCGPADADGVYAVSPAGFVCKDLKDTSRLGVRCVVN